MAETITLGSASVTFDAIIPSGGPVAAPVSVKTGYGWQNAKLVCTGRNVYARPRFSVIKLTNSPQSAETFVMADIGALLAAPSAHSLTVTIGGTNLTYGNAYAESFERTDPGDSYAEACIVRGVLSFVTTSAT